MCISLISAPAATTKVTKLSFLDEQSLRPLPTHFLDALPLTADERQNSAVFILGSEYHDARTPTAKCVSRLAVCRLVPATEWERLQQGATIIYSELYRFTQEERPTLYHLPALCSHVGTVVLNDARRHVLYATAWVGREDDQLDLDYSAIHQIWQVQRFIALSPAQ